MNITCVCENPSQWTILEPLCYSSLATLVIVFKVKFCWYAFKAKLPWVESVATSSNHSEILTIHEANCECIWLRFMIQHIRESSGLFSIKSDSTILFEDNVACIAQITWGLH